MKVLMIGAGNVATVLGRLIKAAGHDIVQVVSRNMDDAGVLAKELGSSAAASFGMMSREADLYIAAMSDAALNEIKENISLNDKLIVHTAGSVSKDVLKEVSSNYGVMYPLQSLSKESQSSHLKIPLLIDGNNEFTIDRVKQLAHSISSIVNITTDEQRLKLHVAAVVTNNFTNHLYSLAWDYCNKEGLDFSMLQPLIEETAHRLKKHAPAAMQTGPAKRKDIITLDKHLRILNAHPQLRSVYLKMTDSIMNGDV
jgi:predicted short-subunit dehydrogenase-like oxidoreductase (DUF2520 family)